MGDDDEDHDIVPSSSGAAREIKAGVVNPRSRSCRGCLFYSTFLRDNGQNPTCYGLSRTTPHIYRTVGDSDRQATKDFKYACLGYGVHKELSSSSSSSTSSSSATAPRPADQNTYGELPLCVGIEFLADRRSSHQATQHPADQTPNAAAAAAKECSQREKLEESVHAMPRPPRPASGGAAAAGSGATVPISNEFSSRFLRCAGLVASAVIRNVGRVAGAARSTFDDIFYPDRRRPK